MTVAAGACAYPPMADGRAGFVRLSLRLLAGFPLFALALLFLPPNRWVETALALLLLSAPWVFAVLAWRFAGHYARAAAWAWYALSVLLALLGLALIAGAVYLMLLGSAFGKAKAC